MSAIKTKTVELPTFEQLTPEEQAKVIENYHDINTEHDWFETVYDDAKSIASLMNIEIEKINFSGFSSQGDGATFASVFEGKIDCFDLVKQYAPKDVILSGIAEAWEEISKRFIAEHGKGFHGFTKIEGHYSHSQCNRVVVKADDYETFGVDEPYYFDTADSYVKNNTEFGADITHILRRFMDWIYRQLEADYDGLTSDESIKEALIANEYTFNRETLKIDD